MTTTRIRFEAALHPDDPDTTRHYTQIHIEAPGQILPSVGIPALRLEPHQTAIDKYRAALPGSGNIVGDIGDALWQCLAAHDNADAAFLRSLTPGTSDRQVSVSFSDMAIDAKELPWEALRESTSFICFDKRVPIVREVATSVENTPLTLTSDEKLRFLAVIAAEGNDGRGEWNALKRSILSVSERLPVEVLVLTSNPRIATAIRDEENPRITAGPVPDGSTALIQRIQSFAPHIAHFFCHGHASGYLELERSSAEWGAGQPTWINAASLEEALSLSAWVTVLNACSLASVEADADVEADKPLLAGSLNLCEKLVERGFPIVIGMRSPVDAGDALSFAERFHASALGAIANLVAAGGGTLALAKSFGDACRAILSLGSPMDALEKPAWTLPVMNLRPDLLHLQYVPAVAGVANAASPDARIEREELQGQLDTLEAALRDHTEVYADLLGPIGARIAELRVKLAIAGG